jgi:hypothetical protein
LAGQKAAAKARLGEARQSGREMNLSGAFFTEKRTNKNH